MSDTTAEEGEAMEAFWWGVIAGAAGAIALVVIIGSWIEGGYRRR